MGVPLLSVEMRGDSDPQLSSKAQEILERRREAQKRVAEAQRRAAEEKAQADLADAEAAATAAAEKAAAEKLAAERAAAEKAARASIALAPKPEKWEPLPDLPLVKRANNPFGLSFTVDIKTTTVEERRRRRERDEMTPRGPKAGGAGASASATSEAGGKPPLAASTRGREGGGAPPRTRTGMHLTAGVGGFRFVVDFKRMLKALPRPAVRPTTRFESPEAPARKALPFNARGPVTDSGFQAGPTYEEAAAEAEALEAKAAAQLAVAEEKVAAALGDAAEWKERFESSEDRLADALARLAAEEARRQDLEFELRQTKQDAADVEVEHPWPEPMMYRKDHVARAKKNDEARVRLFSRALDHNKHLLKAGSTTLEEWIYVHPVVKTNTEWLMLSEQVDKISPEGKKKLFEACIPIVESYKMEPNTFNPGCDPFREHHMAEIKVDGFPRCMLKIDYFAVGFRGYQFNPLPCSDNDILDRCVRIFTLLLPQEY